MKNTIANIRILDVVRLVHANHGYFIFVFLIINMLSYHRTIGMPPNKVTKGKETNMWWKCIGLKRFQSKVKARQYGNLFALK
jgi:hypothetical protein